MQLYELLNELLELLIPCSEEDAYTYHLGEKRSSSIRVLFPTEETRSHFIIKQLNRYIFCLEQVFLFHEKIRINFSKTTICSFVECKLKLQKSTSQPFTTKNTKQFFQEFLLKEPSTIQVSTPISGIFLENITEPVNIGNFTIFCREEIILEQKSHCIYIQTDIKNIYDIKIAHINAQTYFNDFIKLILFISSKFNGLDEYKLELREDFRDNLSSIIIHNYPSKIIFKNIDSNLETFEIFKNTTFDKIELQDSFFTKDNPLKIIWELYDKQINNQNLTDIEMRVLNAALAIGESARTLNIQNSLIYTCIALESLFIKNREDKIRNITSETLSSLISKNKKDYAFIKKVTTQVYDARSDIVHGRRLLQIPNFTFVNKLLRQAIIELLNNATYQEVQTVDDLRQIITDA